MKAIYEADQETEKIEKNRFLYGERSRPAEEWRWLIYATLDLYDSLLKGLWKNHKGCQSERSLEWHWRAMAKAYEAYINGDVRLTNGDGFGKYGGIGWNTWLHLRDYKYQGNYQPLVEEHRINPTAYYEFDNYYIRLTPFGIQYYLQEWNRYKDLYPDIIAPEPKEIKI